MIFRPFDNCAFSTGKTPNGFNKTSSLFTSRVNKLRKEAGLKPVDKVDIFYEYDEGQEDALVSAVKGNEEVLLPRARRVFGYRG
jgi:hypothetical protein